MRLDVNHKGKVFGHVTLISLVSRTKTLQIWKGRCACGKVMNFRLGNLKTGNTTSCGCAKYTLGGKSTTREYKCWRAMLHRCSDKSKGHVRKCYYERGIRVCPQWAVPHEGFKTFLRDMGVKPSPKHSIERKDNDGNYCPENCCWATTKEQAWNKRKRQPVIDVPGRRYHMLTAVMFAGKNSGRQQMWIFRCDCGTEKRIIEDQVKRGQIKSCGCLRTRPRK